MDNKEERYDADYQDFSLVKGGLFYALTKFLRPKNKKNDGLIRISIFIILITWLPMLILSIYDGTLNDSDLVVSFPEDFLMHVRFLLVVPFLILIENVIDRSFVEYVKACDDLIPNSEQDAFNKLVRRIKKLSDSKIPEIVLLLVSFIFMYFYWDQSSLFTSNRNYLSIDENTLTSAGWYYLIVCSSIFLLVLFRWFYRWVIWFYSIIKISRLKIAIDSLHADNMAGLEFLNLVPLMFSFILMAPSALLSAIIGIDIIYEGASFSDYKFHILFYVIGLPILLYSPLLIFIPKLIKAQSYGVIKFGSLIRKHNFDYNKKWIKTEGKSDEALLGSMDNSSLADINGSYSPLQNQKLFPINYRMLAISFMLNVIPYIPLVFTFYSLFDLFQILVNTVVGN